MGSYAGWAVINYVVTQVCGHARQLLGVELAPALGNLPRYGNLREVDLIERSLFRCRHAHERLGQEPSGLVNLTLRRLLHWLRLSLVAATAPCG